MRTLLAYVLGAVLMGLLVASAWASQSVPERRGQTTHTVQSGESPEVVAARYGISVESLAEANGIPEAAFHPSPGSVVVVPPAAVDWREAGKVHGIGLLAEATGVLLSFWLGIVSGLLPSGLRRHVFGIALALGVASYALTQAVAETTPVLTPAFIFAAIRDGFAWSAAFPLFARAFGWQRPLREADA